MECMKKLILFTLLILHFPLTGYCAKEPSLDDLIQAEQRYSKNKQENLKNIIARAQGGDKSAQKGLGIVYQEGVTGVKNRDKAFYWFNLAASQGDDIAQFYVGLLYHQGDEDTPPDYQNAIHWYEKSARQGNLQAQINCANIYQFGPEKFHDIDKAKSWLVKAAQKGNPIAHANLGLLAAEEKNYHQAATYLKFAAEKGDKIGQYNYGTLFLSGDGVPADIKQAKYWFEKAAAQDLPHAQISLGRIYAWGIDENGVDKDKALYWLHKAEAAGAITDVEINTILFQKPE